MEELNQNKNIHIKFNNLLLDFLKDLSNTFPEYENDYTKTVSAIRDNIDNSSHSKKYTEEFKKFMVDIANKRSQVFITNKIDLIDNVDFTKVWSCEDISNQTKNAIWKYIHSLYLVGKNISKEDTNPLSFFKQEENCTLEDISSQAQCLLKMIDNLDGETKTNETSDGSDAMENLFGDSKIGELAQELAGEINISDLGLTEDMNNNPEKMLESIMKGENSGNLMNMIQTVGSKIQNKISSGQVDEAQLFSEAQNMLSSMNNSDMLSNMMNNMPKPPGGNRARDRLRKKLEKRNKNK